MSFEKTITCGNCGESGTYRGTIFKELGPLFRQCPRCGVNVDFRRHCVEWCLLGVVDISTLYRLTADSLNLSPSQHTEPVFRQILGGCLDVVEGLGAVQERHTDTDGAEVKGFHPAPRHAELAVNLAGSMATFLLATWEAKHK